MRGHDPDTASDELMTAAFLEVEMMQNLRDLGMLARGFLAMGK